MANETRQSLGERGGWLGLLAAAVVTVWSAGAAAEEVLDVRQFGAVGDGETMDTQAIQETTDEAAARGGGTVRLPEARFLVELLEGAGVGGPLSPGGSAVMAAGLENGRLIEAARREAIRATIV